MACTERLTPRPRILNTLGFCLHKANEVSLPCRRFLSGRLARSVAVIIAVRNSPVFKCLDGKFEDSMRKQPEHNYFVKGIIRFIYRRN